MRCARSSFILALFASASLLMTSTAFAEDDCPPGSIHKSENGFSWCEPTVCSKDVPCKDNELCRPIALCMEVGTLGGAGTSDAGKRLVVTQRCVAGEQPGDPKTCPQKQTCSDMNRCISKAAAEKLGLLAAPGASGTPATSGEPKKSSCGCEVIGAPRETAGALSLAGLALAFFGGRRRRRISGDPDLRR